MCEFVYVCHDLEAGVAEGGDHEPRNESKTRKTCAQACWSAAIFVVKSVEAEPEVTQPLVIGPSVQTDRPRAMTSTSIRNRLKETAPRRVQVLAEDTGSLPSPWEPMGCKAPLSLAGGDEGRLSGIN